ncbi:MAG: M56 family metallopeptidase [Capsulimonadaceae bacterium]
MSGALVDGLNGWSQSCAGALWRGCWQGTLLLLVIWTVCRLFRRLPAGVRYWLWWLGCVKLLAGALLAPVIPLQVLPAPSPQTIHALRIDTTRRIAGSILQRYAVPGRRNVPVFAAVLPSTSTTPAGSRQISTTAPALRAPTIHRVSPLSIVCLAWVFGVVLQLFVAVLHSMRLHGIVNRALPVDDGELRQDVERLSTQLKVRSPRLLRSAEAAGPCVTGLWDPVVLLPCGWTDLPDGAPAERPFLCRDERRMALAHELAHLKRRDLWQGIALSATSCVFFFWPPARTAVRRCLDAREEASDAAALQVTSCTRAAYLAMLLKAAMPGKGQLQGAVGVSPAYRDLRSRMAALATGSNHLPAAMRVVVGAVVGVGLLALVPWRLAARAVRIATGDVVRYAITDLGPVAGGDSTFFKLNERGQVLGTSAGTPLLWSAAGRAQPSRLDKLYYHNGRGGGVNDNGDYAVTCYGDDGNPHAYYWRNGSHPIHGIAGYRFTVARGMNDGGWIAGSVQHGGRDRGAEIARAVLIVDGRVRDLGTLGGRHSAAYAVNDAGQVVGKADLGTPASTHAFLWQDGAMHDLGTLGGHYSLAYAINGRGQAVGFSETTAEPPANRAIPDPVRHACLWQGGKAVDLGTLGSDSVSEAHDVNDLGQIVGTSDTDPQASANRATLWLAGRAIDLNAVLVNGAGWSLCDAMAINNHGAIVGKGRFGGAVHSFLLTPVIGNRYRERT